MTLKAEAGAVLVDPRDQHAVRNIDNVLTLYQMMINENKAEEGTARFLVSDYIQHNPLIADGSASLGKYFAGVKAAHPSAHVVIHKIIAVGEYVFAHVNFVNLLTDDPDDPGVAGVDIYKMNAEGMAVEHWDALQLVGELTGSVLVLIGRWVWLGAGMLGVFTSIGAVTAHAFWKVSGPARKGAIAVFLMHFGLVAALVLDALLAERGLGK